MPVSSSSFFFGDPRPLPLFSPFFRDILQILNEDADSSFFPFFKHFSVIIKFYETSTNFRENFQQGPNVKQVLSVKVTHNDPQAPRKPLVRKPY